MTTTAISALTDKAAGHAPGAAAGFPGAVVMAARCGALAPVRRRAISATPPFAPLRTAPCMARGHVKATLAQWGLGELADTTEMIAGEMTANAVNASAAVQAADSVPVIRLAQG